jgi:hypothetical protein
LNNMGWLPTHRNGAVGALWMVACPSPTRPLVNGIGLFLRETTV